MKVAGLGFRKDATVESLRAALDAAGGAAGLAALATTEAKSGDPAILALARELRLPVYGIAPEDIARQAVVTQSARVHAMHGTGSVAEASALAAAGPGSRLLGPRVTSPDGMATAALAERRVG